MMSAITAPGGLPMGLAFALKKLGWQIEEVVQSPEGVDPRSRLDIYAQGYWLRLLSCLQSEYPALQRLLGERLFEFFARAYLAANPSRSYSLYDLGSGFARFLRKTQSEAAKAGRRLEMRFPVELALIEEARAASMRAEGMEGKKFEVADSFNLLLGHEVEIALPATTSLLITAHPLEAFEPWLEGGATDAPAEAAKSYIAVSRRAFHVSCSSLCDWQLYALKAARSRPHSLLHCAHAAARRCRRPVHEILTRLAFWLPTAQAGGLCLLSRPKV